MRRPAEEPFHPLEEQIEKLGRRSDMAERNWIDAYTQADQGRPRGRFSLIRRLSS